MEKPHKERGRRVRVDNTRREEQQCPSPHFLAGADPEGVARGQMEAPGAEVEREPSRAQ